MSVINRMLHDLESRGAVPAGVFVAKAVQPDAHQSMSHAANQSESKRAASIARVKQDNRRAWARSVLMSGVLCGAVALIYTAPIADWLMEPQALSQPKLSDKSKTSPLAETEVSRIAAQARLAHMIPGWRLDLGLSTKLIRGRQEDPNLVRDALALSPSHDLSDLGDDAAVGKPLVQPQGAIASVGLTGNGPLMIDPPAAGRVQSMSIQAEQSLRKAHDLLEQGRDAAALDTALQALKLDPMNAQARRFATSLSLDQKLVEQAQILIDDGLKQDPNDGELSFLKARQLALQGQSEPALDVLRTIDRPTPEMQGLQAGLLARTGQYAPAVVAYGQALKQRPNNATWWLGLGVALQAQGQSAVAKEAFGRARRLGTLSADVQAWLEQQM